ncbi:DUF1326 domain-containing protein [Ramlibacter monticola]|uniref:DUF1326 domain-containing protein n=1 Tax=Ramlibacter monticola TaxID=1926872 RepID=A0A936YYX6_9BURK|nr:DUF1326 domain-containing protein [Ramlibacter monticola]MBL0391498.1 DUF1326 domain-containing protein [Ramlibacter monticola]
MAWQISGEYMETCNCAFLCPCIVTNLQGRPTEGDCKAALGMHIETGNKDGVSLDGVDFIAILQSQGPMGAGNMTVGLVIDSAASDAQVEAITAIASGAAGGPMAMMAPLVGRFAGVERAKVSISREGERWTTLAGAFIDETCEGVLNMAGQPLVLDNASHPVNSRLALAKAVRSVFDVFGIQWKDDTGNRNGHYAPFSWSG